MNPVICLAMGVSMPCLIFMICRAWPSGERSGSPLSTFLRLMPRLASLPMTISTSALILNWSSAESNFILLEDDLGVAALEIKAVGQFFFGLVDRVLDFHLVHLRNDVE